MCAQGGQEQVCSCEDGRELIPVLLLVSLCAVFHTNNSQPTPAHPVCVRFTKSWLPPCWRLSTPRGLQLTGWRPRKGQRGGCPSLAHGLQVPPLQIPALLF